MQLVDSTALADALGKAEFSPTTFSLWFDERGQLTHSLSLTDSLVARGEAKPDSGTAARALMSTLIAGAAFPQDSGKPMTVRLAISRGNAGSISLSVAPSVVCSALAKYRTQSATQRITATRDDIDELHNASMVMVSFVVDTTGHPLELLIMQGSGSRLVDTRVIESIASTIYQPATVDGFPKRVTIQLRVNPPLLRP
jgi:TonB family protein